MGVANLPYNLPAMTLRLSCLGLVLALLQPATSPPNSLLIKNGQTIDGTGSPSRRVDIRVAGDVIAEVADGLSPRVGERVIDAAGKVVAPGFIDMHSHADRGIDESPDAVSQVMQGITTAIVGQDGSSELPIADFHERIARLHPAINYATAVGHGTVRRVDYSRVASDALPTVAGLLPNAGA